MLENKLFSGFVRHRRYYPKPHTFQYPIYMPYMNVQTANQVFNQYWFTSLEKFNWVSFYRENYFGAKNAPLNESIIAALKVPPKNPSITMLAHPAYWGYAYNPISLYFIWEAQALYAIIAEVHNTPWGEKYHYVLSEPTHCQPPIYQYALAKKFHVSPFMDMEFMYQFNFKIAPHQIILHMQSLKNNQLYFDATLSLRGETLNQAHWLQQLKRHPFMTQKVLASIYFQALKLYIKGTPVYSHPKAK